MSAPAVWQWCIASGTADKVLTCLCGLRSLRRCDSPPAAACQAPPLCPPRLTCTMHPEEFDCKDTWAIRYSGGMTRYMHTVRPVEEHRPQE